MTSTRKATRSRTRQGPPDTMASQRDVRNKISSVKNIQKITRAMEMVAAARLRRAEQRIQALRPYADAIARMTRQAARAAGAEAARMPLLAEHESETKVGLLLVTGDRGLAGAFNSQIIRAGVRIAGELSEQGKTPLWFASGRRGVSSIGFRGYELSGSYTGFSDRPSYADARTIADDIVQGYLDGELDRVDIVYNAYISPLTQRVTSDTLLPLSQAAVGMDREGHNLEGALPSAGQAGRQDEHPEGHRQGDRPGAAGSTAERPDGQRPAPVEYEPDPQEILKRLVPDFVEISIYRALVESTAGFFGAQMTAMRSASDNAGEIITEYTLQMNRARQAEITQEIMEVVAGAEGLT
jgi:F-type H+-transporting ATPase subunit gamma